MKDDAILSGMFRQFHTKLLCALGTMAVVATCGGALQSPPHRSLIHTSFEPFCAGQKIIKKATLSDIFYAGNIGTEGNYGCNLMLVEDSIAHLYRYTINMTNSAPTEQVCVCWLNILPNGLMAGFTEGNEVLNFILPLEGHRVLAADADSLGSCACAQGAIQTTEHKQFGSTWLEFNLGNKKNNGSSGADASCLVSADAGLDIPGLQVCSPTNCSTSFPGGTGKNAFLKGMNHLDGLGLNEPPGELRLTAAFGYKG